MRIGINTGPVVVGKIGDDLRMDYTAVGDTTNLAARLEQLARSRRRGGIRGDPAPGRGLFRFPRTRADVRQRQETLRSGPTKCWPRGRPAGGSMFTRSRDSRPSWAAMPRAARCSRHSNPRAQGEDSSRSWSAKRGSENLACCTNFAAELADVPHSWFEGRCASFAQTTPFYAIIDAIHRRAGIDDRDDDAAIAEKTRDPGDSMRGADWNGRFRLYATCFRCPAGMSTSTPSIR